MGSWSNVDRPTMRYELLGTTPARGQWKWKEERAVKAVENYRKFEKEFKENRILEEYQNITERELEFRKNKSLLEYWRSTGQLIDNMWIDIETYDYSTGYPTEKHTELLLCCCSTISFTLL
jgi:adenine-specific DNA-methyltransferase